MGNFILAMKYLSCRIYRRSKRSLGNIYVLVQIDHVGGRTKYKQNHGTFGRSHRQPRPTLFQPQSQNNRLHDMRRLGTHIQLFNGENLLIETPSHTLQTSNRFPPLFNNNPLHVQNVSDRQAPFTRAFRPNVQNFPKIHIGQ